MKTHPFLSITLALVFLAGCSGLQLPAFDNPFAEPSPPTELPSPTATETNPPSPTLTPTVTPTTTPSPTPTIYLSPTETPINFLLAETGYDIADVRYTYPREDILHINFKYRLDDQLASQRAAILIEIPRRCQDGHYSMMYFVEKTIGEVQATLKMTMEGICAAEGLTFRIIPETSEPFSENSYEEYVPQPFRVVRNFPTVNLDKVTVRNFNFNATGDWKGILTFEYRISEDIPIPPEEHYFMIRGSGRNGDCTFFASGPLITEHGGQYELPIDLALDLFPGYESCLDAITTYTYSTIDLFLEDQLAEISVIRQPLELRITLRKYR